MHDMKKYIDTPTLCEQTGVPPGTIATWRARGVILAAIPGRNGAESDLWSPIQCLALAVARGLRRRQVRPRDCYQLLGYLWMLHRPELEREFARGAHYLMLAATARNGIGVLPRLVIQEAVTANPNIDYGAAAALGVQPSYLDLLPIWRAILAKFDAIGVEAGGTPKQVRQGATAWQRTPRGNFRRSP
jgi:hypothetical protein